MHALLIAVLSVALGFLALTLLIVVEKAWREARDRSRLSRRGAIEPRVLSYAHGADPSIVAVLGGRPTAGDRVVVESILFDHVLRVRGIENERICRALDELGYVDGYIAQLRSGSWWRRAEAAEKLGLSGAKRATEALTAALSDDESEVRLRAAKALGLVGGRAAVLPLVAALSEPNRWSTIRIADILASMGREVVSELMDAFTLQNRNARLAALDILGRIHLPETVPWLIDHLSDEDRDVRARAAQALGAIGAADAAPALRNALIDPEWPVRAMAAKALGSIRDTASIPVLCAALRDREWWVRANAGRGLRAMGAAGVDALESMLQDADLYAKHQACLALEDAGLLDRRVGELAGTGPEVARAASILSRFIAAGQTGRLRELAGTHPDPAVRDALVRLLPAAPSGASR